MPRLDFCSGLLTGSLPLLYRLTFTHTAARVIFLKQNSGHGAPLLQTYQIFLIFLRIKSILPMALHNLWPLPSFCPSPTMLQPHWCFCLSSISSSFCALPPGRLLHLLFHRTVSSSYSDLSSRFTSSQRPSLASLAKAAYQSLTTAWPYFIYSWCLLRLYLFVCLSLPITV